MEDLSVLRIDPFDKMGTPTEIIKLFGGREQYLEVIKELENQIYAVGF